MPSQFLISRRSLITAAGCGLLAYAAGPVLVPSAIPTALAEGDGQDLYFIKTANTPNGTVEVHAATATSAYQEASHHDTTLFSTDDAPNGTFHMVGQDLYFIKTANTPNGTVEVHAATATSAYQEASHHDTTLFSTDDAPNGTFHMVGQESSPEGTGDTTTGGGRFNAGIVAAASQYADGSWGDQCAVFAENMIAAVGGPRIFLGNDPAGYQAAWAGWCTEQTWQTVAAGDICQWYDPSGAYSQMHTAIMTSGGSPDTATVVDSNFGTPLNQELVHRGSWSSRNVCFHEGTYKFWRVN